MGQVSGPLGAKALALEAGFKGSFGTNLSDVGKVPYLAVCTTLDNAELLLMLLLTMYASYTFSFVQFERLILDMLLT